MIVDWVRICLSKKNTLCCHIISFHLFNVNFCLCAVCLIVLPDSNIYVLDSILPCKRNIESLRLILTLCVLSRTGKIQSGEVQYSCILFTIMSRQCSTTNYITLQLVFYRFFTTLEVLSFNKASYRMVFLICVPFLNVFFSYSDQLLRKLFHYLMTLLSGQNRNQSNVFILTLLHMSIQ